MSSLFHYTPKYENLIGIITNGFRYNTIKEDLPLRGYSNSPYSIPGVINYYITTPIVCFCDIPFRFVKDHLEQYGEYGLGLKKEWAIENGITPIRYFHFNTPDIQDDRLFNALVFNSVNQSRKLEAVHLIVQQLKHNKHITKFEQKDFDNLPDEVKSIIDMFNNEYKQANSYITYQLDFLRAYEGKWKDRVTSEIKNRVFYDEKEWRAVQQNPEIKYQLFEFKDITHFIIKSNEERLNLIKIVADKYKVQAEDIEKKIFLIKELKE